LVVIAFYRNPQSDKTLRKVLRSTLAVKAKPSGWSEKSLHYHFFIVTFFHTSLDRRSHFARTAINVLSPKSDCFTSIEWHAGD